MAFFNNKRKDFSIQPPTQSIANGAFTVSDSANIDFTYVLNNLTANLTNTGVVAGTYGDATNIPVLQIDQFGRVTGVTTIPIGGGGGSYTVNNGLTASTPTNFQWGGSLIQNTTINGTSYSITFNNASNSLATLNLLNTGLAAALIGQSNGGAAAELITSLASTNTVQPILEVYRKTSGLAANGIGGSIDFWTDTLFQIGPTPAGTPSTRLISKWTSAGLLTRTSQFEIETVQSAVLSRKLWLTGSGQLGLDSYGIGTYSDTPAYLLGVDASGNVIEVTPSGGGGSNLNDTTGILFGGALSATIGGTTFSVTAGIGQIVTQAASISGVVTTVSNVTWSAVTGAAITNIGTSQFTYVLVNSSGVVIQQTTPFTDAQYKTHIIIGILCHIDLASVNLVTNAQNVAYEDPHRLVELIDAFGPIKKTGLNISANGANLRVNRASGEAFKIGANYITDQFEPDVRTIAAQTPVKLCRVHRDGSGGFIFDTFGGLYYDDIDPNQYDDGSGTLQPVVGSKWTIQRLFFFPNNPVDIICYYGTQRYNQFSEARANLEFETFDEATITAENAVFLGFLFVRHAATNLSLSTQASFLQSGLFRGIPPGGGGSGGGGGITSLNSQTGASQTFANGASGTSPAFVSALDIHTLNIPLASAVGVTAGLVSKTDYDVFNAKQDALTTTKSVKIVSSNVELDNDEASPTARKFYSTSGAAAKGWRTIEKADLPVLIQGATYPYVEREYISLINAGAIVKIPGSDVIFVAYTGSSSVIAYDTTTSEIKSTTTVTGAIGLVYVALTSEVWAFGTLASVRKFDAVTGVDLGPTAIAGLTANCRGVYDDSLVTGNIYAYNGGTMNIINALTNIRTGVSIGGGSASWELTLVTSGPQAGLLVGSVNIGTFGFNKATNTLAYGPINLGGYQFIKFVPSLGVFIASSFTNKISFVIPTTPTTLTLSTTLHGINTPYQFEFDETENRLFASSSSSGTSQMRISVIDLTSLTWIKSVLITAVTTNSVAYMASDKANKAFYVVGNLTGGSVNKIIYE